MVVTEEKGRFAKEEAEYARLGKDNPWHKFTDEKVMQFVHARYYFHPELREFIIDNDDDVRKFQKRLVRNL